MLADSATLTLSNSAWNDNASASRAQACSTFAYDTSRSMRYRNSAPPNRPNVSEAREADVSLWAKVLST